jgi:hydroxymethylpyrimidine/phosphomethylpyrimidine kinase
MKSVLTIAGSDPTSGAGLQADLKVFSSLGVHGLSVPSALTAQNTVRVSAVLPVEKKFFVKQLNMLLKDIMPDAVKTGMLPTKWIVKTVAEKIVKCSLRNLVIDPVAVSSSGTKLIEDGALVSIKKLLFPLARIITPNIYEAFALTRIKIKNETDMEESARKLKEMGPEVVIITGGHLKEKAVDLYYDGINFHKLESQKIEGEYHGTGCAFSAALTAFLASGHDPLDAAKEAKDFINEAIKNAYYLGKGMGLLNF